jgi:hydrogenase nickel incorporation protein HypA/HybF
VHEYSLVRSLLGQVDNLLSAYGARHALEIRIAIGPLSGVDATLVKLAYEDLTIHQAGTAARLNIELVPLLARCDACDIEFEVIDFRFRCARCDSGAIRVTSGDGVQLVDITVDCKESQRNGAVAQ